MLSELKRTVKRLRGAWPQVRVTTRKVWLSFSESYPYAALLRTALEFMWT